MRVQHKEPKHLKVILFTDLTDGEEIPERFRHLPVINIQKCIVHPVSGKQPAVAALTLGDLVLMMGENKILAPGMRLGYVIAPPPVIEKLTLMQSYSVLSTTCFSQLLAARVMNSGILKEHLPRVRALYRERAEAMLEGLEELMPKHPEIRWTHPKGGMFIWLTLPRAINTFKMMPKSLEKKVLYLPGDTFYAKNPEHNTIRLAFATMDRDKIREGLKRLAALVRQELAALQQPSGD